MAFSVHIPRIIHVGGGASKLARSIVHSLNAKSPLIVTDSYLAKSGLIEASLGKDLAPVYNRCISDPTSESVSELVHAVESGRHDCLIAFGGGSPMDTAKAAAVAAVHAPSGKTIEKLREWKVPFQMHTPGLPVVAIPTTAGTGSEVTRFTVISDPSGEKMLLAGAAYVPSVALVDFELTLSQPWRLTADTAIDSLTHAIESYVSKKRTEFTKPLSLAAMEVIADNVLGACVDPADRSAREALMFAATQAGLAFSNASVALVHAMARPLGVHFHVPHGLSNAMLLSTVTEWSLPGALELYADCALATGALPRDSDPAKLSLEEQAGALVTGIETLCAQLRVPSLREYGIEETKFRQLVPIMADQAIASGSHLNNPRVPTASEIEDLFVKVYEKGL